MESVTTPSSIMQSGFTKFVIKTGQVGEREGEKEVTLVLLTLSCVKLFTTYVRDFYPTAVTNSHEETIARRSMM